MDEYVEKVDAFARQEQWAVEVYRALRPAIASPKTRILDCGCGTGRLRGAIGVEAPNPIIGLDMNCEMLTQAAKNDPQGEYHWGHWDRMAELGPVDVVFMHHSLAHMQDHEGALAAAYEALVPGGWLVIVTPNARYRNAMWWHNRRAGYKDDPTIKTHWSAGKLARQLKKSGFEVRDLEFMGEAPKWMGPFAIEGVRSRIVIRAVRGA